METMKVHHINKKKFDTLWRVQRASLRCLGAACVALAATASAVAADKPVRGGTLVYPVHMGETSTYDCQAGFQNLAFRLAPHYSTLVKLSVDKYPQVEPDLAQSWKVSDDGLRYEFSLHPNVKFHDGSALTSADVKATLDRLINPPEGVVSVRRAMYDDIKSIEAPNATTLVLNMKSPNSAILPLLGVPYACIYSAKLLATDPSYPAKKIMGSGPFRFVRHTAGQDWIGERFDDYFKPGKPYLDGFRVLNTTQPGALTALLAGQVHYTMNGQTPADAERVRTTRGDKTFFVGGERATPLHILIAVNTQRGPLSDVRVRRALTLAMDRYAGSRAMANLTPVHLNGGLSRPGSTFARSPQELETLPGFGRDIAASRQEARRLLAEAGQQNLKLVFVNRPQSTFWGVYLADQLRQIGVTVEHQVSDNVNARKKSGDYDLIVEAMPEYLGDPIVQWSNFLPFDKNPANTTRSNDPQLEVLYNAQKREVNPEQRRVRVQEMEKYLIEQAYVLPMFWQAWRRGISTDVGGVVDMPSNFLNLDLSNYWLRSGGAQASN